MSETSRESPSPPSNLTLFLSVDEHLTWGDLGRFIDLARQHGVDPTEPVLLRYVPQEETILDGLVLTIDGRASGKLQAPAGAVHTGPADQP